MKKNSGKVPQSQFNNGKMTRVFTFSTLKITERVIFQWSQFSTLHLRGWNTGITTQERKVCDMEIESWCMSYINGSVKLAVPTDRK